MDKLGKYIDPFTDFGFKRLFGSEPNKNLLIDFLNELLRGRKKIKQLTFIYLEMTKFNKTEEKLVTHFDKWLFLLKNLYRFQEVPAVLQEKIFRKAFKIAEVAQLNQRDMEQYQASLKYKRDWKNTIDYAVEEAAKKAAEEATKIAIEVATKESMRKVAKSMKDRGYALPEIAEITGLSVVEIEKL